MTHGCLFFNFGDKCVLRLLTALYTLRKVYSGPVTVMLAKNDTWNELVKDDIKRLGCDYEFFDMEKLCRRNLKSVLKPGLFKNSCFDTTLMFDGDLVFRSSPEDLFNLTKASGFLVTHFSHWYADGRTIKKRVNTLKDLLTAEELKKSLEHHPAINIGVMGYNKGNGDACRDEWEKLTLAGAGRFIIDEIAAQCVYHKYPHHVADCSWNTSCRNAAELLTADIVHYHGNKHTSPNRLASRFWWACVKELSEAKSVLDPSQLAVSVKFWLKHDEDAQQVFNKNGKYKFINKCYDEFKDKLIKA